MRPREARGDAIGATARRYDPDRWRAAQFALGADRAALLALLDLDAEIGGVLRRSREPLLVDIKLAWWADAVEAAPTGAEPRRHPALDRFAEIVVPAEADWAMLADVVSATQGLAAIETGGADRVAARARLLTPQLTWWWGRVGDVLMTDLDRRFVAAAAGVWARVLDVPSVADQASAPEVLLGDQLAELDRADALPARVWPAFGMLAGANARLSARRRPTQSPPWRARFDDLAVMWRMIQSCARGRL